MAEELARRAVRSSAPRTSRRLEDICAGAQVIVVANREPYAHDRLSNGRIVVTQSSSGVVNAVEPLLRACGGVWVAHGSGTADMDAALERDGLDVPPGEPRYRLRRVWLSQDEQQGYYRGFANEALWPLCHRAHVRPIFRSADFEAYAAVNGRFAEAVCDEASDESPIVLVQDYHFALAPQLIREQLPLSTIVSFWHIPWPEWQTFEICPWRRQILQGLLGSSIIGFQTPGDCRNFLGTVEHAFEAPIDSGGESVSVRGRRVLVRAYPASVAWTRPAQPPAGAAENSDESVRRELGLPDSVRIGVGVDRLDYTKGLEEKFLAIERLLESFPEFLDRFVYIQLAEPSRLGIPAYDALRARVRSTAGRINRRFGHVDYCPIVILEGHHNPEDVCRYLRAADLCCIASLHDGMNLVSKEFVRARTDERGVLILSAFAGAARELTDALIVNPYDADGTAAALAAALTMSDDEQRTRMRRMRHVVARFDAHRWGADMLADAADVRSRRGALVAASDPGAELAAAVS